MAIATITHQCSIIEELQTTEEVEAFVKTYDPKVSQEPEGFRIPSTEELAETMGCRELFKEWGIKNWEKADLNNDGRQDLLLYAQWYGTQPMAVLDLGDAQYQFIRLKRNHFERCELFKPIQREGRTLIASYGGFADGQPGLIQGAEHHQKDTLSFFNNTLLRYNPSPAQREISSVKLVTTACFGQCPEFSLELFPDNTAAFEGLQYTPLLGGHQLDIENGTFQRVEALLNYMDVETLRNDYAVLWTDDQTGYLSVSFTDGSKKTIKDYGLRGTRGLEAVYQIFMEIAKTTDNR
jgi:hypothetical protein